MVTVFGLHVISTWLLVALIWFIQVIVYPRFLPVSEAGFVASHFAHCLRVGFIIVPLMGIEAISAAWLFYQGHREIPFLIGVGLIVVIWLSTAVIQAPMHAKLMQGFDAGIIHRLIRTNWVRTFAWTARGVLVGYMIAN